MQLSLSLVPVLAAAAAALSPIGPQSAGPQGPAAGQLSPGNRIAPSATPQKVVLPVAPPAPTLINALPFIASTPGYYLVTKDLTGVAGSHGIIVTVRDVVIDLGGFTLTGGASSLDGINAVNKVTVIRGDVADWGGRGLNMSSEALVSGVEIRGCGEAGLFTQGDSWIQSCRVGTNAGDGIACGSGSTVLDCTASFNGMNGLIGGLRDRVHGCTFNDNGMNGMRLALFGKVSECSASRNDQNGIHAGAYALVDGCSTEENAQAGFFGESSTCFSRCVSLSDSTGIRLDNQGGRVESCMVGGSTQNGILVDDCARVADNQVVGGTGNGVVAAGQGNRIEGNHVARTAAGIVVTGTSNLIVRNTLEANGVQTQIGPDNTQGPLLKTKGFLQNENPWANFDLSFPPLPN